MVYQTKSEQETKELAKKLAQKCKNGGIFALFGDLGAGKTTFAQGFAQGLNIKEQLISPTFVLIKEYQIPNQNSGKLYHIDLYRLENLNGVRQLGLEEIFENHNNIILIEWADKLGRLLPKKAVEIYFKQLSENQRQIKIGKRLS